MTMRTGSSSSIGGRLDRLRPVRRPGRAALALGVLLAVFAASCGSDSGTDASDDGDGATEGAEQTVRVGYAYPDLEAFATLVEDAGVGDPELQAEAVLDWWERDGLLPDGIEIELVFGKYDVLDPDEKLAVCTSFAEDEDVFVAVSGSLFSEGAECLATRFSTPVIATDMARPSLYERGAPWYFTLLADEATYLGSYADWLVDGGFLEGKRVGLYFETRLTEGVAEIKRRFEEAGVEIVAEAETSGEGIGGAEDELAMQRFIENDVDVVLPLVGGSSTINILSFADSQDFHPEYFDTDYADKNTDLAGRNNPAEQYDGTLARTMSRSGELASDVENPATEECLSNYERFAGEDVSRDGPVSGEVNSILRTCDLFNVLRAGLEAVEGELDQAGLVEGLETVDDLELAGIGNGQFSAEDHSLVDESRTIRWDGDCPCWMVESDFEPMEPAGN